MNGNKRTGSERHSREPKESLSDFEDAPMLTVRRLIRRAIVGLIGRGSQGLLLASSIIVLGDSPSSDLAVALTVCTVMNMVSNAGIPTLFVRGGRGGRARAHMLGLARSYLLLTGAAGMVVVPVLWTITNDPFLALASGLLLLSQSVFTGYEYWVLGKGTNAYDMFLRRAGPLQATLSVLALPALVITESVSWGVAALGLSYFVAAMASLSTPAKVIRDMWPRELGLQKWGRDAGVIGLGTILSAFFYGIDVAVLRLSAGPELVAEYRLAIIVVSFIIGILPISLFVLADAAGGQGIRLGGVFRLVGLCIAAVTLSGLVFRFAFREFEIVGLSLLFLGPLAGIRLLTQVMSSNLNGQGHHSRISASYAIGLLGWLIVASLLIAQGTTPLTMALSQTLLEFVVLVSMAMHYRRQGLHIGHRLGRA